MTVYNIYFSPTGGTKKVADILSGAISRQVQVVDLLKKEEGGQAFSKEDICVISVPAFGGRVPLCAAEKLKTLKADGTKAIAVAVFGNRAIDDTLLELSDLLSSVGFTVIADVEAVAEHSLARMYGAGRPNSDDKAELEAFAKAICEKLQQDDRTLPQIPGNRPYKECKTSAMSLVVDDTCINCKKCARECPVNAIPLDKVKAVDEDRCFSCMHCVSVCPQNARHNAPEVMTALAERLRERCAEKKPNKLYI